MKLSYKTPEFEYFNNKVVVCKISCYINISKTLYNIIRDYIIDYYDCDCDFRYNCDTETWKIVFDVQAKSNCKYPDIFDKEVGMRIAERKCRIKAHKILQKIMKGFLDYIDNEVESVVDLINNSILIQRDEIEQVNLLSEGKIMFK